MSHFSTETLVLNPSPIHRNVRVTRVNDLNHTSVLLLIWYNFDEPYHAEQINNGYKTKQQT